MKEMQKKQNEIKNKIRQGLKGLRNSTRIVDGFNIAHVCGHDKRWKVIENEETFIEACKDNFIPIESYRTQKELIDVLYKGFIEIKQTSEETNKIDTAIKQLSEIGYEITAKVILAQSKLDYAVAWHDKNLNHIYLTRKHLGTLSHLKNTLLEEYFYMLGHEDGQQKFVTFLIDEIIKSKENKTI